MAYLTSADGTSIAYQRGGSGPAVAITDKKPDTMSAVLLRSTGWALTRRRALVEQRGHSGDRASHAAPAGGRWDGAPTAVWARCQAWPRAGRPRQARGHP